MMRAELKRCLVCVTAIVALVLLASGGSSFGSEGDMTVSGVVSQTGFGKFILKVDGKDHQYNIGRGTSYVPGDFRPMEGDTVKVVYYDKEHRGQTIQAVKTVELIKANPNFKEPSNPVVGTIKEAGRKAFDVYIPDLKKTWKFEMARGAKVIPRGWRPAANEKVKVEYQKVPSRFTGSMIYQIKSFEKIE